MPAERYVPLRAKLAVGAVDDPSEAEADRIADRVMAIDATEARAFPASSMAATTASPDVGSAAIRRRAPGANAGTVPVPASVRSVVASAGAPLDAGARAFMEPRFGRSFADVRVHDGPLPSHSAASIGARAYTVASHIVFRGGDYAPTTPAGRHLLAHELAHVAQASAEPQAPIRRKEQGQDGDHPEDADVSLGVLDSDIFGSMAEDMLGDTAWAVLREFLRGSKAGLLSAPPGEIKRIADKFNDAGMRDYAKYFGGLMVGTAEGLWSALKGLFEAIWTLVKLPYEVVRFFTSTLPELAEKYAPQIQRLVTEAPAIEARVHEVIAGFFRDPQKTMRQASKLVDALKGAALGKVRSMGRAAAGKVLGFLDEPWPELGEDVGKVFGQVLFEVILAVASDFIGNVVKETVAIAGRLAARVTTGIVDTLRGIGRLVQQAMVWLDSMGEKLFEGAGEALGGLKAVLKLLRDLIIGVEPELEAAGVGRVPVRQTPTVLEARAVGPRDPKKMAELYPSKFGSRAASASEAPKVKKVHEIDGKRLIAETPEHKAQRWLEYQQAHPDAFPKISKEIDPEWSRLYHQAIANQRAGGEFEREALKQLKLTKNNKIMMPPPDKANAGIGFIPDAVIGHDPELELVWNRPYHFVEVKGWKDMSMTGNLSAMLEYVESTPGSRITIIFRSDAPPVTATTISGPLRAHLDQLVGMGRATILRYP